MVFSFETHQFYSLDSLCTFHHCICCLARFFRCYSSEFESASGLTTADRRGSLMRSTNGESL